MLDLADCHLALLFYFFYSVVFVAFSRVKYASLDSLINWRFCYLHAIVLKKVIVLKRNDRTEERSSLKRTLTKIHDMRRIRVLFYTSLFVFCTCVRYTILR